MPHSLTITESQYRQLRESLEAQEAFLTEAQALGQQLLENTSPTLLHEGLVDSFKKVMAKGGFANLRHAVQAALVAGSLAGVTPQALGQAATEAGASPEQAQQLAASLADGGGSGAKAPAASPQTAQFARELTKLHQRYVIDDQDPARVKHFMKFTGAIQDVVGIEPKNGFPIFAPNSASQKSLDAAFAKPKVITGTVNVRGRDFAGQFIEHDGLYYTYDKAGAPAAPTAGAAPAPAASAPSAAGAPSDPAKTEIIDFTGLWQGAEQFYRENRVPASSGLRKPQDYGSLEAWVPAFFRASDPGFEGMSDEQIVAMFDHGLKARVEKGKFKMGGQLRPALNRR